MSVKATAAAIQKETERRKKIWKEICAIAKEAYKVVQKEANKRGAKGTNWLGGCDGDEGYKVFMVVLHEDEPDRKVTILIETDSSCDWLPEEGNGTYQNYPNFGENAAKLFEKLLVPDLFETLTDYCEEMGLDKKK